MILDHKTLDGRSEAWLGQFCSIVERLWQRTGRRIDPQKAQKPQNANQSCNPKWPKNAIFLREINFRANLKNNTRHNPQHTTAKAISDHKTLVVWSEACLGQFWSTVETLRRPSGRRIDHPESPKTSRIQGAQKNATVPNT